jgi:serine/threonine protein kinase
MLQATQVLQGCYQLQHPLGKNAGRQTWLATDIRTSPPEPVTVKLLAFSPQMQWDEFKLFEREANVLKQLNHPRIPMYRDYFSLDKQTGSGLCWFGLVQDYIPGYSLQQLLDKGKRFTEAQVRSIAIQVLKILTYLHGLNPPVLHRDIKPSNLILGKDKQIYLVDFGAVQDTAAVEGVTFTVVGTTGYAPLEQFWGKAVESSDLYALGATLIHLLTGCPPADLPQSNLRIQFKHQVSLNTAFLNWIETLTEPDLNLRLSTATEALKALQTGRLIHHPLERVYPPFRTKIQLYKSATQLKIKISGQGILLLVDILVWIMKLILVLSLGFSLLVVVFLLMILTVSLLGLIKGLFAGNLSVIIFIPFVLGGLFFNWILFKVGNKEILRLADDINQTIFSTFGTYYIEFNRSCFSLKRSFFRFSYYYQKCLYSNIFVFSPTDTNSLSIRSEYKKYYLGKTKTKAECKWLIQEIKDWLS